jgi:hypothetical protein
MLLCGSLAVHLRLGVGIGLARHWFCGLRVSLQPVVMYQQRDHIIMSHSILTMLAICYDVLDQTGCSYVEQLGARVANLAYWTSAVNAVRSMSTNTADSANNVVVKQARQFQKYLV